MERPPLRFGVGILAVVVVAGLGIAAVASRNSEGGRQSPTRAAQPDPSPSTSPSTPTETQVDPRLLLPNMRSLDASELQIEVRRDVRRLRFAASLANLGPGPLILDPRGRAHCPSAQRAAVQLLHYDTAGDGKFQRGRDPIRETRRTACMLDHRGHDHWHFDAMAGYALRRPEGDVLAARPKVSFCLRDNERVSGQRVTQRREHFGDCSRHDVQGISPGWVDVYSADLRGQSVRLPADLRRRGGVFCLDLTADPRDLLLETDETDNATSIPIQITGRDVRRLRTNACG